MGGEQTSPILPPALLAPTSLSTQPLLDHVLWEAGELPRAGGEEDSGLELETRKKPKHQKAPTLRAGW